MPARVIIWATGETARFCECGGPGTHHPGELAVITDGTFRWVTCPICRRTWNADGGGRLTRPPVFAGEAEVPSGDSPRDVFECFQKWQSEEPRLFLPNSLDGSMPNRRQDLSHRLWMAFGAGWNAGRMAIRGELEKRITRTLIG